MREDSCQMKGSGRDLQRSDGGSEARFASYVEGLSGCLGHADRVAPMRSYCTRLLLPGGRKSLEPMAARLRPDRTSAEHQSLLHFVGQSPWDADVLLRRLVDQGDRGVRRDTGNTNEIPPRRKTGPAWEG